MIVIYLLISVVLIIVLTTRLKLHPFLALFLVAIAYGFITGMPIEKIFSSIYEGFGNTLGGIGLIIILGVIIGTFLEETGGAFTMAEWVLKVVGKKRVPLAMSIIGYFVSIPVFADSGFLLLSPLNKSLSKKAGISLAGSTVALALGLTATHTMVPPTPGPIAAARFLDANLGFVLMIAIPISALALTAGWLFATKYAAKTYIDPNPEFDEEEIMQRTKVAPSASKSSLPIVIPILLIVLKSLIDYFSSIPDSMVTKFFSGIFVPNAEGIVDVFNFLGEPIIALIVGTFLALLLPKKLEKEMLSASGWVGKALVSSSTILLITGAGGIFGKMLQNSGIADLLGDSMAQVNIGIWLPFLIAAALKTAQGSSTVALITTASIVAPIMGSLGFETEIQKALVVVAIGAGSAVFSHANDSFFWVITQMTGMDVKTGYRFHSLGTLVLGTSAAVFVYITYLLIA